MCSYVLLIYRSFSAHLRVEADLYRRKRDTKFYYGRPMGYGKTWC